MKRILLMMLVAFTVGTSTVCGQGKPQCPKIVFDDPEFYLSDVGDGIIGIRDSKNVWKFYHLTGTPLNDKTYMSPLSQKPVFNSGVCPVQKVDDKSQWILLKKDGSEIVLPKSVSLVSNFKDGLALAKIDYVDSYIDVTGKRVFPHLKPYIFGFFVLDVKPLRCNRRAYKDGNEFKSGFIDKTGKIVIPAKYDDVRDFTDGLAIVKEDNTLKVIDENGRVISTFPEKYKRDIEYMKDFVNGVTIVIDDDTNKPVLIDKNMNVITNFYYVNYGFYKDGGSGALAIVKQTEEGPFVFVNTKGEYVADAFINDDRTTPDGKIEKRTADPHDNVDSNRSWDETGLVGMGYELVNGKIGFAHGRSLHSFNRNYYQIGTFDKSGYALAKMYEVVGHGKYDLDGSTYEIKEPHYVIMDKDGAPVVEIVIPKNN